VISVARQRAIAAPVTCTLTGYVQAPGGGQQVSSSFTWTVTADTANVTDPSPGHFQNAAAFCTVVFPAPGTVALSGVTECLNTTAGQVTLGSAAWGSGLTSSQLQTWDLASPIGPLNATIGIAQSLVGASRQLGCAAISAATSSGASMGM
jgi:hypothetical protein